MHGNYTEKGKPFLACDPHLNKAASSYFYLTRISWNETRLAEETGEEEEYKTYLIGGTLIGVPQFMYGRTPFASWGVTALYPDVMDLYVENIRDETHYLDAVSGEYEPIETITETIGVRFGSDVTLETKVTRSGIIMPLDIIDGQAG